MSAELEAELQTEVIELRLRVRELESQLESTKKDRSTVYKRGVNSARYHLETKEKNLREEARKLRGRMLLQVNELQKLIMYDMRDDLTDYINEDNNDNS